MAAAGLFPELRRARLKRLIDWEGVGLERNDFQGLADYVSGSKFDMIGYWIGREDLDWYRREDPFGSHQDALELADRILSGSVPLAGCGAIQVGAKIPWTRDPVTGKQIWTRLGALRPRRDVDTRFWVELNLHRHFAPVARAGAISGDRRFSTYIVNQWSDWLKSNPPIDEEYVSDGLELSLRVLIWTHVLFLLGKDSFGTRRVLRLLALVAHYGEMIEAQCDGNSNRNNHLAAEAFGLYFIGSMYPELKPAARWRDKGLTVLAEVAEEQFSRDGVHVEEALGYQLFVAEILVAAQRLAQLAGHIVPNPIAQRLDACLGYLSALTRADGSMVRYGDEGLVLFSPTGTTTVEPGRILSLLRRVVRAESPAHGGEWNEETFWVAGRGHDAPGISPAVRAKCSAEVFDRGHVVLKAGEAHLHFDCSSHGWGKRAGHGHDDALSFDYHHDGRSWVGDIGTYTYLRRGVHREYFAGARGHNGILFNGHGAGVMVPNGSFGWLQKANAALRGYGEGDGFCWAAGRHLGAEEPCVKWFPVVDRFVVLTAEGTLLIVDWCEVKHHGTVDNLLHFHPGVAPAIEEDRVRVRTHDAALQVLSSSSTSQTVSLHSGADAETPGWYSERYGAVVPACVLRLRSELQGAFWRVTALVPGSAPVSLEVEASDGARLRCSIVTSGDRGGWFVDRNGVDVKATVEG